MEIELQTHSDNTAAVDISLNTRGKEYSTTQILWPLIHKQMSNIITESCLATTTTTTVPLTLAINSSSADLKQLTTHWVWA